MRRALEAHEPPLLGHSRGRALVEHAPVLQDLDFVEEREDLTAGLVDRAEDARAGLAHLRAGEGEEEDPCELASYLRYAYRAADSLMCRRWPRSIQGAYA